MNWTLIVLVLAGIVLAWLLYAIITAPTVNERNCKARILLENGRCPGPCKVPPPCTDPEWERRRRRGWTG